jgi:hypothetical protein
VFGAVLTSTVALLPRAAVIGALVNVTVICAAAGGVVMADATVGVVGKGLAVTCVVAGNVLASPQATAINIAAASETALTVADRASLTSHELLPLQSLDLGCRDHAREASRKSFHCAAIDQRFELTATHAQPTSCLTDRQHADTATRDGRADALCSLRRRRRARLWWLDERVTLVGISPKSESGLATSGFDALSATAPTSTAFHVQETTCSGRLSGRLFVPLPKCTIEVAKADVVMAR